MKVLIVSPIPTDPPIAGNRARVAAIFTALVRSGHEVIFAYVPYDPADYDKMRERLGGRLRVLHAAAPPFKSFSSRLRGRIKRAFGLKSGYLLRVDEWFDEGLLPQIQHLHEKECFEAVLIEYVYLSKLACGLPASVRTIIDTHDIMGDRHKQYFTAGMQPTWFATKRAEEISALNRVKAVIAIQQQEANYFRQNVSSEVFCVGHILDPDFGPLPDPGGARILFVGSINTINLHGVKWFLEQVFPRIQKRRPDVELALAGAVGGERTWPNGTLVLGPQQSLAAVYAAATLVINPVQFGTGLAIKTVEALSYGKPVVATPAGARGLDIDFRGALCLAETPDAFAEQVLELLENVGKRSAMAHQAIAASHQWQHRQVSVLNAAITGQPHIA
jgi:glycosyltransferase involved in cell wall biosynthesis